MIRPRLPKLSCPTCHWLHSKVIRVKLDRLHRRIRRRRECAACRFHFWTDEVIDTTAENSR